MSAQLFNADIKPLTVSGLKSIIADNKWNQTGIRLKADFQKFIVSSSYYDTQNKGIALMKSVT